MKYALEMGSVSMMYIPIGGLYRHTGWRSHKPNLGK
jgi:hypothetical protein